MDWGSLIVDLVMALVAVVVPILGTLLGKLIKKLLDKTQTDLDDRAAAVAVAWAEDQLGSKKGKEKFKLAVSKLKEWTKGRIDDDDVETLVSASYKSFANLSKPIKNG